MIAAWMLYATVVGALVAAAAFAADAACLLLHRPRRGVWLAALGAMLALPALVAVPSRTPAPPRDRVAIASTTRPARVLFGPSLAERSTTPLGIPAMVAVSRTSGLRTLDAPLVLLWALGSLAGLAALGVGAWRLARARRAWHPLGTGDGVLVSDGYGPAVAGVRRPVVVVPRWLLALAPDDLTLVLAHERAHLDARDPLLLGASLAALVVLPWLAPLWFIATRLRLAVESDCDRRVLRAHPDVRRYGRLLVDVAERGTPTHPLRGTLTPSLALLEPAGVLEARIRALLAPAPNGTRRLRAAALLAGALGGAALACESPQPHRAVDAPTAPVAPNAIDRTAAVARVDSALPSPNATSPDVVPPRVGSPNVASPDTASLAAALDAQRLRADSLRARNAALEASMAAELRSHPAFGSPVPRVNQPADSALRAMVATVAPGALSGEMGPRPTVWVLLDSAGGIVASAMGAETMSRYVDVIPRSVLADTASPFSVARRPGPVEGTRVLDAEGFYRTFPSLHEAPFHSFGWSGVSAGAVRVNVLWGRSTLHGWKLSDLADQNR